jgi:hypothetical protein
MPSDGGILVFQALIGLVFAVAILLYNRPWLGKEEKRNRGK